MVGEGGRGDTGPGQAPKGWKPLRDRREAGPARTTEVAQLARPVSTRPFPPAIATTPWGQQDTRTKEVALRSPFQGLPAHAIETRRGPHRAYHASLTTASNPIMVHIGPPPKCRGKNPQPDARECPAKLWWGPVSVFQASDPHRFGLTVPPHGWFATTNQDDPARFRTRGRSPGRSATTGPTATFYDGPAWPTHTHTHTHTHKSTHTHKHKQNININKTYTNNSNNNKNMHVISIALTCLKKQLMSGMCLLCA